MLFQIEFENFLKQTCCCLVDDELSVDLAGLGNGDMLTDC